MSEAPTFLENADSKDTAFPRFTLEVIRGADVEGKPTFQEVEMVEIIVPADRGTTWFGRVTDEHRHQRFPRHYNAWKAGREEPVEGTPLSEVAGIGRAQVEELAFNHVKTVEQLAALTDLQLQHAVRMGGLALREKAKRYLDQINGSAPTEKLAAENDQLKANMALMQKQIDDLVAHQKATAAKQGDGEPAPPPAA